MSLTTATESARNNKHNNNETMSSSSSNGLTEELNSAQVDAKETLLALLQFSEGVQLITRHMQTATDGGEECKEDDSDSNPSLAIERMVADTRLQGTVFGTDLLRLWDAAHHLKDYARLVTEESTFASSDIVEAQQTAKRALQRAQKAESLALGLHKQNQDLRLQLNQLSNQKKCLVQEVKTLRQQAATSRKMDMERLLQQHVAGAILLHEEQLKAMAATAAAQQHHQQQQQQQRRKPQPEDEEEKKEEEEDMEVLVKAEDGFPGGVKRALASPRRDENDGKRFIGRDGREKRSIGILAALKDEIKDVMIPDEMQMGKATKPVKEEASNTSKATNDKPVKQADKLPTQQDLLRAAVKDLQTRASTTAPTGKLEGTRPTPTSATAKVTASSSPKLPSPPSTPDSAYSPVKLFPSVGRLSPLPSPFPAADASIKPSSSRSVASSASGASSASNDSSVIHPPPEQPREHVGSKVFNFLFHPEKIAEKRVQEMKRQKQLRQQPSPKNTVSKHKPLLAFDDLEKEEASVDATAPTLAATTPGSTCTSSSVMRARSMSNADNNNKQQADIIIPNCVSFSDDTLSVQSNLPSPKFQARNDDDDDEDNAPPDVELYKDFKLFQSLAIPADEEIDEYHHERSLGQEPKQQ